MRKGIKFKPPGGEGGMLPGPKFNPDQAYHDENLTPRPGIRPPGTPEMTTGNMWDPYGRAQAGWTKSAGLPPMYFNQPRPEILPITHRGAGGRVRPPVMGQQPPAGPRNAGPPAGLQGRLPNWMAGGGPPRQLRGRPAGMNPGRMGRPRVPQWLNPNMLRRLMGGMQ
jgi:hypothetical protein